MTWEYRPFRAWQGKDTWKRIVAIPMLASGLTLSSDVRPGQTRVWIVFSLVLLGAQVIYCRTFRVSFDWVDSSWRVLRIAWIVWGLLFGPGWLTRFYWLPPNPVWLAGFFVGGACFSACCIGTAALWGIDFEQT